MSPNRREDTSAEATERREAPRVRLEEVLPGTEHPDPAVAASYIRLLWQLPCDATFERLMALTREDAPPEVLEATAYALGRYIWSGMQLDPVLDEEFGFGENVTEDQVAEARKTLHALTDDPRLPLEVREEALRSLAYDPDEATVAKVEAWFQGNTVRGRVLALACMGRSGFRRWHDAIAALLDPAVDEALLEAAIDAAGEACLEHLEPRVVALTHDHRPRVARAATWALRNVAGTSVGRQRLFELLDAHDPELASRAREAIMILDGLEEWEPIEP